MNETAEILAARPRRSMWPSSLLVAALGVGLSAGWLTACGGSPPPPATGGPLVIALRSAPIRLDPRIGTDQASSRIFELALDGLVGKDPEGNYVPGLAASWEVLDNGTRYRFHLRPGVTFHDGQPLTSADVVWTFGSILDGTVPTAKRGALPRLQAVEAVDPLTVDFRLDQPFGAMLADLTSFLGIVRDGSTPEENERSLIGTGPFRVVDRQPDRVDLEAFDDYWQGRPHLDHVVVRAVPDSTVRALELRKGTVHLIVNDLAPDVVVDFRDDPSFQVISDPGSNYAYVGINFEDPMLARIEVRRAMALAIDRDLLVKSLWRGMARVTATLMRPGHWSYTPIAPVPHDPEAARRLLDKAGIVDPDGDGPAPRLSFTYKTSTDETYLLQAQIIQSMLAEIGIAVEIRSYEFATFYSDIKSGNFQLFTMVWNGIVDPNMYALTLHSERVPPNGANRGHYRNLEFDRLVEEGAVPASPAERRPYYVAAQEIFARDLPYISLYLKDNVAVMPAALRGYRNYSVGELYSVREMSWASPAALAAAPPSPTAGEDPR
jgi:peptide/nickel transport system substrate-binding protein